MTLVTGVAVLYTTLVTMCYIVLSVAISARDDGGVDA